MERLEVSWFGKPAWMWLGFFGIVATLLVLDLGVFHRKDRVITARESLVTSAFYISLGLAFGGIVWWQLGAPSAVDYVTGFVIEKSLAMDNVFVIAIIFGYFGVPAEYQHRVLFWGVLGVIVLRAIMIGLGSALLASFGWVLYIFAAFLIFTGIRMWLTADKDYDPGANPILKFLRRHMPVTDRIEGHDFFVKMPAAPGEAARWHATPLFLALAMVEIADLIFAIDSVPAIFAVTTDPFIVYTSNIFAILGLRALYFALAALVDRFHYLKYALAVLLVFIGAKIFVADALGLAKVPPPVSLGITLAILLGGVGWSLWRTRAPAGGTVRPG